MVSTAALQAEAEPITACTVSRDVQLFDLLIEDMEAIKGEGWGDLGFDDALAFFDQPEAEALQFLAVAMDQDDEDQLDLIAEIVSMARARGVRVVIVAEDVSPVALHRLLREGGDEFVPYPLPEGELASAVERMMTPRAPAEPAKAGSTLKASAGGRSGVVIPVHGMAGGCGTTTMAVNLAWELALADPQDPPRVCLMDLDLQFGSVGTYLDLPRREAVLELLSNTEAMDGESFMQALVSYDDKLHVLTAPSELVPLDLIGPEDAGRLIAVAREHFDYVVIDMPSVMVEWSQTVLEAAHVYFALLEMDMRSAQNTLRIKRALQSEDLPFEKLRFILNRAPKFTDLSGRSRIKRLAESLGISIEVQLPDGGRAIAQNADHGMPLSQGLPKAPLRREIAKLAAQVHEVNQSDVAV